VHRRSLLPCIAMCLLFAAALLGCSSYEYRLPKSPAAEGPSFHGGSVATGAADVDRDVVAEPGPAEPMMEMEESSGGAGGRARFLPPPPPAPVFAKNGGPPPKRGEMGAPGHDGRDKKGGEAGKDASKANDAPPGQPTPPPKDVQPQDPGVQAITGPMLIYNATVYMAVFEAKAAIDATLKLARDMGGYLVRRDDQTIVIRVPAAKYREALDAVGKLGDVIHREESVQDVTDEFLDMQVRLQNARALRARLEQLLAQAKNVEEALMVERELARVTEEIERFEGRLKLLRELVMFSTITIEFKPRPVDQIQSNIRLPFEWLDQLGLSQLLSL
jgi:hypothetical protein